MALDVTEERLSTPGVVSITCSPMEELCICLFEGTRVCSEAIVVDEAID